MEGRGREDQLDSDVPKGHEDDYLICEKAEKLASLVARTPFLNVGLSNVSKDSLKLPIGVPTMGNLKSFACFVDKYRETKGNAVAFSLKKVEKERVWQRDPGEDADDMTVSEYLSYWDKVVADAKETQEYPSKIFYLTNVPLLQEDLEAWQESHPFIDFCAPSGLGDLDSYISLCRGGTIGPDVAARGYIAPPIGVGSGYHLDGGGASLSVHSFLFGCNGYQQVSFFRCLSSEDEKRIRRLSGREHDGPFFLPHDPPADKDDLVEMIADNSLCCYNKRHCREIERDPEAPRHHQVALLPGSTMFLAAGNMHAFKKCHTTSPQPSIRVFSSLTRENLLFSVASDTSYIGINGAHASYAISRFETVAKSLQNETMLNRRKYAQTQSQLEKKRLDDQLVALKQMLYTRYESGMVFLVLSTKVILDEGKGKFIKDLHVQRVFGVYDQVQIWLREQMIWAARPCEIFSPVGADRKTLKVQDWLCSLCGRELANVFFTENKKENPNPEETEVFCFHHIPKTMDVMKILRIGAPDTLKDKIEEAFKMAKQYDQAQKAGN